MTHLDDALLAAFTAGELGEHLAVHVAHHLDACPRCRARADALDPLAEALRRATPVAVPDGFVERVLEAAARPERPPTAELWVGSLMLLAAATLTLDPAGLPHVLPPLVTFVSGLGLGIRALGADPATLAILGGALGAALAGFAALQHHPGRWEPS